MMYKKFIAIVAVLFILLSTANAFAVVDNPYITVSKEVSSDTIPQCGTVSITLGVSGHGDPLVVQTPVDVMLVIDKSGSMDDDGGHPKQPIYDTKQAAKAFVDQLDPSNDRSGLVTFSTYASLDQSLTFDQDDVKDEIDDISVGGYTAIGSGIQTATSHLVSNGRTDAVWVQVLLSDGNYNAGVKPLTAAAGAASNGIIIFTIGLGSDADGEMLQDIADATGGDYYYAPDSGDLEAIYDAIAQEIEDIAGSNVILTDILPEGVEISGDLPEDCSSTDNPDGTTTVTCQVPGNVNIDESFSYPFDVTVNACSLSQINLEGSGVSYNDYNGDPQTILFINPPVVIINDPPVLDPIGDKEADEGEEIQFSVSASDSSCAVLSYWVEGAPAGSTFEGQAFDWSTSIGDSGVYTMTFWVEDQCGESDSEEITITLNSLCDTLDTPLDCVSDGNREWLHEWNYAYCGDDYYTEEQDAACSCEYTEWADQECVSDGMMSQTREELSGYAYCDAPLYQEVENQVCECVPEEVSRECTSDGYAEVYYTWNYDYCGPDYSQQEQDPSCSCIYTDWQDAGCVDDGLMSQLRSELSGYAYCDAPLYQEVPDQACDCDTLDTPLDCVSDGNREWLHEWNYAYCGDDYYTDEQDAACDCYDYEYDRICIDDDLAEVYYTWNFAYCGPDYSQQEYDAQCGSDYQCDPWYNLACISDGIMAQERYCEDQYGNFYYDYQEVSDAVCDCADSEYDRICVSDGYADVYYTWNYDYCGPDYSQQEQDATCSCDYTPWIDDICVSDGFMSQIRSELSGYAYCDAPLYQEVPNAVCDCEASEYFRECVADGYADVYYTWNYDYCGDDYIQSEQDAACDCIYTEWIDDGCVDDGFMSQIRSELSGRPYCDAPLYQEVENQVCDCVPEEVSRECVDNGYADVLYTWNYDYCGDDFYQNEYDPSCECVYSDWFGDTCIADGIMIQFRTELSGFCYCLEPLSREVENEQCDCDTLDTPLECSSDGNREWLHEWNYAYCGDDYYTEEQDAACDCYDYEYDRICIDDDIAEVYYTWNFAYCGPDYSQQEYDAQCGSDYQCDPWYNLACISDGIMAQERYCEDQYDNFYYDYQEVSDAVCDCDTLDTPLECSSDGNREWLHEWNYAYCGDDYYTDEQDATCSCEYTEWADQECVSDGMMSQTREELSGYAYCDAPLYQEVENSGCGCVAEEEFRDCVADGYADVYYEWSYDYCGDGYYSSEQDEECSCEYTEWYDFECVADGMMSQYRSELTEEPYCEEPLYREVENEQCDCETADTPLECSSDGNREWLHEWNYAYCGDDYYTEEQDAACDCAAEEVYRECVDDGYAAVYYEWNYYYCGEFEVQLMMVYVEGPPGYAEIEEDESCSCEYTDWTDQECVSDGMMAQYRTELSEFCYCEAPLYQETENEQCGCQASETGRVCTGVGTALVDYDWNYGYCGEPYSEEEEDISCYCAEGETRNCGSSTGRCEYGTETCTGGVWSECAGGIGPIAEICGNGIDENCDGSDASCGGGGGGGGGDTNDLDWCGNLWCGENETCETCPRDCGVCEIIIESQGSEPGEGDQCISLWECGNWSECVDGKQARTCRDRWECEEGFTEYDEERDCTEPESPADGSPFTGLITGQGVPFAWWILALAAILSGIVYWKRDRVSSGIGRMAGKSL